MSTIEIIILSFIQGLTEFLPISSSGHLIIAPHLLGWDSHSLEMDVAMHLGTLMAVLLYFRQDLLQMFFETFKYIFSGFNRTYFQQHARLSFILILATVPAIITGMTLKKIGIDLVRHVWIVAFTSIFFGIVMYVSDRHGQACEAKSGSKDMGWGSGFMVGIAQALALIPGTSRSGICITAARFMGFSRISAARFSFLLSIPSILGAGVLTAVDAAKGGKDLLTQDFCVAIFASFVFGLMAVHFMLLFLSRHGLGVFTLYRLLLGGILLMFFV
jgi:undecaprenyl-diphosphatase